MRLKREVGCPIGNKFMILSFQKKDIEPPYINKELVDINNMLKAFHDLSEKQDGKCCSYEVLS
jgi:hypothetical protein